MPRSKNWVSALDSHHFTDSLPDLQIKRRADEEADFRLGRDTRPDVHLLSNPVLYFAALLRPLPILERAREKPGTRR